MNSKFSLLPVFLAFTFNGSAADVAKPAVVSLATLIPAFSAPLDKESEQRERDLEKLVSDAARPGAGAERVSLAKLLCDKAADAKLPFYARSLFLRHLALIGGAESVDPLASLLSDPDLHLREYAREALERNSDCKAGAILCKALKQGGDTQWQIGLMNSLGMRREAAAVPAISSRIANAETSKAALTALGKIATPDAVAALEKAFPASAEALMEAARRLAAEKGAAKASALASKVFAAKVPEWLHAEAFILLETRDAAQVKTFIPAALATDNVRLQAAAVSAAFRVCGCKPALEMLRPQISKLKTVAKLELLRRLDASAENDALALLDDPAPDVQAAAMTTLGRIGSAASVPALLKIAGSSPRPGTPASDALSVICGPGADDAIRKSAANLSGDSKVRALAIAVLGWRGNKSAASELVGFAAEPDPVISRAACAALKTVGTDAELMPLLKLVLGGKVPNAESAVRGIASRSVTKQACVPNILAMGKGAEGKALVPMLVALSLVGGPEGLQVVIGYTQAAQPEVVEGAVGALCNWRELDAVEPLLKVGADPKIPERLRIAVLRSIEQIVLSTADDSPKLRVDAALGLLKTATRDEEKGLAISAIATIPNKAAADALVPLINDLRLKNIACQASVNLAETVFDKNRGSAGKLANAVIKAKAEPSVEKRAQEILRRIALLAKH